MVMHCGGSAPEVLDGCEHFGPTQLHTGSLVPLRIDETALTLHEVPWLTLFAMFCVC